MNVNFLIADFERKSQTLRHCFFHALCKYNFNLNVSLPQSESNTWARQVYPGCQRHPFVLYGPWERSVDGAMRFPNHRHIIQEIIFLITKRQESFIVYNSSKLSLNCLSGTLKVFVFVKIAESKLTWTVEAISVKSLLTNTEIRAIGVVAVSPVMALSEILLTLVYICWINRKPKLSGSIVEVDSAGVIPRECECYVQLQLHSSGLSVFTVSSITI